MKFKTIILIAILSLVLFSCGSGNKSDQPNDQNNADISDSDNQENPSDQDCINSSYRCLGNMVQKCDEEKWQNVQKCADDRVCNEETGKCDIKSNEINDNDDSDKDKLPDENNDEDSECTEEDFKCHSLFVSYICQNGSWKLYEECPNNKICNDETGQCEKENPCNTEPCSNITNSTGVCTRTGETTYSCGCNSGYAWSGTECLNPCKSNDICASIPNSSGICITENAFEYSCECNEGYVWNGAGCFMECSPTSATPCIDSATGLTWSATRKIFMMSWDDAVDDCIDYFEGGLSGWHLPTISELRTLIQNCAGTVTDGSCGVTDDSLSWYSSGNCDSCSADSSGGHSKFGETDWFWSSSVVSDSSDQAWYVNFGTGSVKYLEKTSYPEFGIAVKCVTSEPVKEPPCNPNHCASVVNSTGVCNIDGKTYSCGCKTGASWNGSQCVVDLTNLPECSSTSATPCKDSTSALIWSAKLSKRTSIMNWDYAKNECDYFYFEAGLSDWHLPTIDELKTLLIADRVTNNCQVSNKNNCLSYSDCWSCSTCSQQGIGSKTCSNFGTSYSDGRYSKFGDTNYLWSSSLRSDATSNAWSVNFDYGYLDIVDKTTNKLYVRCVRNQ